MKTDKSKILSICITNGKYSKVISGIISLIEKKINAFVIVSNVHMVIEAYNNIFFREMLEEASIATADGMPLVLFNRWINKVEQERAAGMDLLPDLLNISEERSFTVLFYGGDDAMLKQLENKISNEHPNLSAHYVSPPFRELTPEEVIEIDDRIRSINPNIIFVCLGCPKQEKWMYYNHKKFNAVMIGVGGAVPVYAGVVERSPRWMQRLSLEWLFRLQKEPKRLFRRYLYTNTKFLWLTLWYLITKKV